MCNGTELINYCNPKVRDSAINVWWGAAVIQQTCSHYDVFSFICLYKLQFWQPHNLTCSLWFTYFWDICMHACNHEQVLNLNMFFTVQVIDTQLIQAKQRGRKNGKGVGIWCTLIELSLNHTERPSLLALSLLNYKFIHFNYVHLRIFITQVLKI